MAIRLNDLNPKPRDLNKEGQQKLPFAVLGSFHDLPVQRGNPLEPFPFRQLLSHVNYLARVLI
jgi:hypothetical protein